MSRLLGLRDAQILIDRAHGLLLEALIVHNIGAILLLQQFLLIEHVSEARHHGGGGCDSGGRGLYSWRGVWLLLLLLLLVE